MQTKWWIVPTAVLIAATAYSLKADPVPAPLATPAVMPGQRWTVVPVTPPAGSNACAILLDVQTGDTWTFFNNGNASWSKMSR